MFNISNSGGQVCRLVFLGTIAVALLAGCGGSSSSEVAVGDDGLEGVKRRGCVPEPVSTSGYSLVLKSCDVVTGTKTYYDRTECVRDNATGLIWQGQTPEDTGLRATNQWRYNFDSTTELQKYHPAIGRTNPPTQAEIDDISNAIGFKNAINATKLCGSSKWRIPTKDELLTLIDLSRSPTIDEAWFPNLARYKSYWSSTAYTGPVPEYRYTAWGVDLRTGKAFPDYRGSYKITYQLNVRLVQ